MWLAARRSPDEDGDRYIEIWNLVFMQFNRDETGTLHPLPKPSVDTGMGLERISAVMQHVHSNYEIDLFQTLIHAAARVTDTSDLNDNSLKVIADHIRACAFLITDGVIPSNEGRGYVLRRVIRRAIRHGYKLGQKQAFFHLLVADLAKTMGAAYPELVAAQDRVAQVLKQEEERFAETLEHGMAVLEQAAPAGSTVLDGETAFKLYDTYGFPLDLTADVGRERGFSVDMAGFETAMEAQRTRAPRRQQIHHAQRSHLPGATHAVPRLRPLEQRSAHIGHVRQWQPGRQYQRRRCSGDRTRPDTILCGIGRSGRRLR
jgi:alanyl-tRNA synthetase (EC 6.1.1.7)